MIYLDTNVFLRHLTEAPDTPTQQLQQRARELFRAVEHGDLEVTTSEIALHETLYFLTHRDFYNVSTVEAVASVRALLQLKGFRFFHRDRLAFFRALNLFEARPSLGFADSVIAARCETNGWELATFDEQLGSLPNIARWTPAPAA